MSARIMACGLVAVGLIGCGPVKAAKDDRDADAGGTVFVHEVPAGAVKEWKVKEERTADGTLTTRTTRADGVEDLELVDEGILVRTVDARDEAGRLTGRSYLERKAPDAELIATATVAYTLDEAGRVTREVRTDLRDASRSSERITTYTASGKRATRTSILGGQVHSQETYTYDAQDRLVRVDGAGGLAIDPFQGRLTMARPSDGKAHPDQRATATYDWDRREIKVEHWVDGALSSTQVQAFAALQQESDGVVTPQIPRYSWTDAGGKPLTLLDDACEESEASLVCKGAVLDGKSAGSEAVYSRHLWRYAAADGTVTEKSAWLLDSRHVVYKVDGGADRGVYDYRVARNAQGEWTLSESCNTAGDAPDCDRQERDLDDVGLNPVAERTFGGQDAAALRLRYQTTYVY